MKRFLALLLCMLTAFSMLACGGDKYSTLNIESISGFGQNIVNQCSFEFPLDVLDDPALAADKTFKIDTDKINVVDGNAEVFCALTSSSPEVVLVVGAKDPASAKSIIEGPVSAWVKNTAELYSGYAAEQVPKLDSCVKMTAGRYAFLVVSSDNAAAKTMLNELIDTAFNIHN